MAPVHPMSASRGKRGRPWERVRKIILKPPAVCWICGGLIDPDLPPRHPRSGSVDHVVALANGGDPLSLDNLRPCHFGENASRGARDPVFTRPDRQSEQW